LKKLVWHVLSVVFKEQKSPQHHTARCWLIIMTHLGAFCQLPQLAGAFRYCRALHIKEQLTIVSLPATAKNVNPFEDSPLNVLGNLTILPIIAYAERMHMLLIHRTVLKELAISFAISLLFLNVTLMMEKLLRLARILSGVGASPEDMFLIIMYLQPQILILTIPMALLLSILLTYGRLNVDNELIIMRTCGMSFRQIAYPAAYLGIACFGLSLLMSFYLGPRGAEALRLKVTEILTIRAPMTIEEGAFNTAFKDVTLLVRQKPDPNTLIDIFIVDERNKDEQKVITARKGVILQENEALSFLLTDGQAYITKKDIVTELFFGTYHLKLTPSLEPANRKNSELTPWELFKASRETPGQSMSFILELHRRLSLPAVCVIIILLGTALSLIAGKSGRLGGLTIGLSVFAVYYTVLIYGEKLARSGSLPHYIGAWLSFIALSVFSLFVFERVNKR
jgi:lipopolysaccharide export system permease protein